MTENGRAREKPQRTCLGCRQARPRASLLRLVQDDEGQVHVDWRGDARGRGAYVCAARACLARGLTKGRLDHAFRRASTSAANAASILAGLTERVDT